MPRRFPRACRRCAAANPALAVHLADRRGGRFGEATVGDAIARRTPAPKVENVAVEYDDPCWFFFTSGTTGRSKAAVLTHGQMAFVVTNHLADLDARHHRETTPRWWSAPLSHGAGIHQLVQTARGVPTILLPSEKFDIAEAFRLIETAPRQQHVHGADHPEDDGRASRGRPVSIIPRCATSSMPARRCIARTRRRR